MTLIGHGTEICTSTTRPSTAVEGMMIYETDTDKVLMYSGSIWVEVMDITNGASNPIMRNVQATSLTTKPSTTSTTYVDITGFSVNITPSSASSKILILINANFGHTAVETNAFISLLRGSTVINKSDDDAFYFFRATIATGNIENFPASSVFLDSPGTTSQVTYKLQWKRGDGTLYLNRRGFDEGADTTSNIIAIEVPV